MTPSTQYGESSEHCVITGHNSIYSTISFNTFVFVDMKFNLRQASVKFHINKNAGVN